jgi:DNA polymerase
MNELDFLARSKSELFDVMGLGPVWMLKSSQLVQSSLLAISGEMSEFETLFNRVSTCRACGLCETRTQVVFSDGVEKSSVMVIGEAPGADEDGKGLPFVGRAGRLLDRMLLAMGRNRKENIYLANLLKCHPPGNRDPELIEIERCLPFLLQQIVLNQPKVILLLGQFAAQTLLNTKKSVAELRGQLHRLTLNGLNIPVVVTYHPAYLLRRPEEKSKVWDDLLQLQQFNFD